VRWEEVVRYLSLKRLNHEQERERRWSHCCGITSIISMYSNLLRKSLCFRRLNELISKRKEVE